jgi:ABC-type multidrug transport system fused ATPase/permease subunit
LTIRVSCAAGRESAVDLALIDRLWRRLVAWVPQHPTPFRGTVAQNIALGDPSTPARQLFEAAALAGADEFIKALPDGYATLIGDGGRTLSPGERRPIGLARAFLKDAPLVILDKPDLDPRSVARYREPCGACGRGAPCC